MTKTNRKNELIKQIIKDTKSEGTEVFDILNDKSEKYLLKLAQVVIGL